MHLARRSLLLAALVALVALVACTAPSEPPLPHVPDLGGPHMTHPQLVTITYADETDRAQLEAFSRWIVGSRWLTAVGAEYGVSAGTALAMVERTDNAPDQITDTEIGRMLARGITDGSLPRPPDGDFTNTLYLLHFPAHTAVTLDLGGQAPALSCRDMFGYHNSARHLGVEFAYAVIVGCESPPGLPLNTLELREYSASHEFVEAVTDSFPLVNPAFALRNALDPWSHLGGEVADLCNSLVDIWRESGFVATRSWSNRVAAARSGDPCVPTSSARPYFDVIVNPAQARRVRPGEHLRYELTPWSTAPVEPWRLFVSSASNLSRVPELTPQSVMVEVGHAVSLDVGIPADTENGTFALIALGRSPGFSDLRVHPLFVSVGPECGTFTDCEACTAQFACGWCASSRRCVGGDRRGASDGSCHGRDWGVWGGACPGVCARHGASCADCTSQPGCGWCTSGGSPRCLAADASGARSADGACSGNDWSFVAAYCPDA